MMPSRGMGVIAPGKVPRAKRRGDDKPVGGTGKPMKTFGKGGKAEDTEKQRQKEYLARNPQYKEREKGLEAVPIELAALGGSRVLKNLGSRVVNELLAEGRIGERTPAQAASQIARRAAIEEKAKKAKGGKIRGLYENIHKKRARMAAGSGERMRRPGSAGAPTAEAFRKAAKTAKK